MKAGCSSYKVLCFNRKFKTTEAEPPPDVRNLFAAFSDGRDYMLADQFLRFLVDQQGDVECTQSEAEQILEHYEDQLHLLARREARLALLDQLASHTDEAGQAFLAEIRAMDQ